MRNTKRAGLYFARSHFGLAALVLSVETLGGCGLISQPGPAPSSHSIEKVELDLFAARGFLGGSDYEHYTMKDGILWRECGALAPKSAGGSTESGKNAKLRVQQKRLESLTGEMQHPVIEALQALKKEATAEELSELPKPESVRGIRDGGVMELQVDQGGKKLVVLTNMNALSEPKTKLLQATRALFEKVRGRGPLICDAQTFFGIGRK